MRPRFRRPLLVLLALCVVVASFYFRRHFPLSWAVLHDQLSAVSFRTVALALLLIYVCFWLRAWRWSILIRTLRRVSPNALFPSQAIGFTAVALIGRVADFARPYLVAKRLELPVAGQLAVYSVERAFDLASAAAVFSLTLACAPANLPHHHVYVRAGELSLLATVGLAAFATALRLAGSTVAAVLRTLLTPISETAANTVFERVLDFRDGLRTVSSGRQLTEAAAVSLLMWWGIASCYLLCARAFMAEPTLAGMSFTAIMLVFASSLGGSLLQLPVLGWFTQIAVMAAALHTLLYVPLGAATACATLMLLVMTLAIVPAGLLLARLQGTSLRAAARNAEESAAQVTTINS